MSWLHWRRSTKDRTRKVLPRRPRSLGSGLKCEPLENRKMLALLGVSPAFPIITYDNNGVASYDAVSQNFDINACADCCGLAMCFWRC